MTSSVATIGLLLSLAQQGLLPLDGAIPVVLGANIGTCATALAASLRSSADARRVAVAHIAFKVLGVAMVFPFIQPLTALVTATAGDTARQIANTHTFFNVAISAFFLPFAPWAARAITMLVPDDATPADNPFKTRYLDDRYLDQPALALGQATREALRMGDVAQGMLRDAMAVLHTDNQELLEDVERRDDQLDYLEREIKLFLSRLGQETMSPDLLRKEIGLISFIGNLENIGDIVDKNLMELARKKLYQGRRFSEAGEAELLEFHGMVSKNLERAHRGLRRQRPDAGAGGAGPAPGDPPARARAPHLPPGAAPPGAGRVARDVRDPPGRADQPQAHLVAHLAAGVSDPRRRRVRSQDMAQRLRVLLVASEASPFAKTGGLGDVAAALPRALRALGHDVRILMPRYRGVERHASGDQDRRPAPRGAGGRPAGRGRAARRPRRAPACPSTSSSRTSTSTATGSTARPTATTRTTASASSSSAAARSRR